MIMKVKLNLTFLITYLILIFTLFSCSINQSNYTELGVSKELAELREKQISNIKYSIFFEIPDSTHQVIKGKVTIEFNFSKLEKFPLIIDFQNSRDKICFVKLNQKEVNYRFINNHIVIQSRKLNKGENLIEIDFVATDRALNRNKEYLYTLFVPDRASTAFPCFDQPSLKATFTLELKTPKKWIAIANSEIIEKQNFPPNSITLLEE